MTDDEAPGDVRLRSAVLTEVDRQAEALIAFAGDLVRLPTVNPPGELYRECAELIGRRLDALGFSVEFHTASSRPEHTEAHPRVNVVGTLTSDRPGPCVHLNGHFDVVPPGGGWTFDPFAGDVVGGRLRGRGSADMKAGLAAAVFAASALQRAGALRTGSVEVSGTVDEESGGFAGVAHLAETGRISSERTDYVIIPEPFGVDRISVGHRGVYWFRITASGRTGHGSMPFLGRSAIDDLTAVLTAVDTRIRPDLSSRSTSMPVVPTAARSPSINVNSITGGQPDDPDGDTHQSPCVADTAAAVFDRRFLPEEDFGEVKGEVESLLNELVMEDPGRSYQLDDLLVVHPTRTPPGSPLVYALEMAVAEVVGQDVGLVASPGTYDQKHVVGIAGVQHCVAYGPGELEQAHQPDETCLVADVITSAKVMALASLDLLDAGGGAGPHG